MKTRRTILVLTVMLIALVIAGCGGGGPQIDNRVLQLSISYSTGGPVAAQMSGGRGAASSGSSIECRMSEGDDDVIGRATANQFGAFTMELDHTAFPERAPSAEEFGTFNEIVECRIEGGPWRNPLRQPQIQIG